MTEPHRAKYPLFVLCKQKQQILYEMLDQRGFLSCDVFTHSCEFSHSHNLFPPHPPHYH